MIIRKRMREEALGVQQMEEGLKKSMVENNINGSVIKVVVNAPLPLPLPPKNIVNAAMKNIVVEKEKKTIIPFLNEDKAVGKGKKETKDEDVVEEKGGNKEDQAAGGMFWEELELSDWEVKQEQSLWKTRDWEWIWYPYWDDHDISSSSSTTTSDDHNLHYWAQDHEETTTWGSVDLWKFPPLPNFKYVP